MTPLVEPRRVGRRNRARRRRPRRVCAVVRAAKEGATQLQDLRRLLRVQRRAHEAGRRGAHQAEVVCDER